MTDGSPFQLAWEKFTAALDLEGYEPLDSYTLFVLRERQLDDELRDLMRGGDDDDYEPN